MVNTVTICFLIVVIQGCRCEWTSTFYNQQNTARYWNLKFIQIHRNDVAPGYNNSLSVLWSSPQGNFMSPQALFTDLDSVLLIDMDRTVTVLDKANGTISFLHFLRKVIIFGSLLIFYTVL